MPIRVELSGKELRVPPPLAWVAESSKNAPAKPVQVSLFMLKSVKRRIARSELMFQNGNGEDAREVVTWGRNREEWLNQNE
jgi:alpha/beta superfamily hydrolase